MSQRENDLYAVAACGCLCVEGICARVEFIISEFFLIAYLDIIFFSFFKKKIIIFPSVWKCTLPHLVLVNWWREAFKGHASYNLPSPGKKMPSDFFLIVLVCLASLSPSSAVSVFLYLS